MNIDKIVASKSATTKIITINLCLMFLILTPNYNQDILYQMSFQT